MSNKKQRDKIVEAYVQQIESIPFVSSDGVIFHMVETCICPLCLSAFAIDNDEMLSLEHVPPESVGGRPLAVTCKECNNTHGAEIDVYLTNELEIKHNLNHFDTIPQKSRIAFNGVEINGQTTFRKNNGFRFLISPNNNNPYEFNRFIKEIENAKKGWEIKLRTTITNHKRDTGLASIALLKSAYLIAFHQLGYMFVMSPAMDKVREQLHHPEQKLLDGPFIIADETDMSKDLPQGVFYAKVYNRKCFVVVMDLKLSSSAQKYRKTVVLPHTNDLQCDIYSVLSKHVGEVFNVRIEQLVSPLPIAPVQVDEKINDLSADESIRE